MAELRRVEHDKVADNRGVSATAERLDGEALNQTWVRWKIGTDWSAWSLVSDEIRASTLCGQRVRQPRSVETIEWTNVHPRLDDIICSACMRLAQHT